MKTQKLITSLLALGIGICLPIFAGAADKDPSGTPEKKKDKPPGVAGEILAIDSKSIQVKSKRGETVTVLLADTTLFGDKREPKQLSDFKVGDMIAIAYNQSDDGKLTATRVMTPQAKGDKGDQPKRKKNGDAPPEKKK